MHDTRTLAAGDTLDQPRDARRPELLLLEPGVVVDGFQIERHVADGGFASVYRARRVADGETVALKVLRYRWIDSELPLRRFEREAAVLARLRHPNLVSLVGWGYAEPFRPYLALSWIDGRSLSDELAARGSLSATEAVAVIRELCAGLAVAHAAGVVHRDIKASNVMVEPRDGWFDVKLVDFGIARRASGTDGLIAESITVSSAVVGTPHAMAPEQFRGGPIDARTDVYALGLLLYRCLTGRHAFEAGSVVELSEQQLSATAPRPSDSAPVPEALDAIVARCLAREPVDRYASVDALADALVAAPLARAPRAVRVQLSVQLGLEGAALDDATLSRLDALLDSAADQVQRLGARVLVESAAGMVIEAPTRGDCRRGGPRPAAAARPDEHARWTDADSQSRSPRAEAALVPHT